MTRLLFGLLLLIGCDSAAEVEDLPFETIADGRFADAAEPLVVVARSSAEFDAVVRQRLGGASVSAPDFGAAIAVFIFHGPSRSGTTQLRVDGVDAGNGRVRVRAVGVTPCIATDDIGSPWAVVSAPPTEGRGVFASLGDETGPCE